MYSFLPSLVGLAGYRITSDGVLPPQDSRSALRRFRRPELDGRTCCRIGRVSSCKLVPFAPNRGHAS